MKIITWNVNGLRALEGKGFLEFLETERPDILSLQETKAHPRQLKADMLRPMEMSSYWSSASRAGYSGVATFTKLPSDSVDYGIGKLEFDEEGRIVATDHGDFQLYNIYFPNGGSSVERHDYKQRFLKELSAHLSEKVKRGEKIIVVGDYNIARLAMDVFDPQGLQNVSGFLPEEREWFENFLKMGFVDTFRKFHPDEKNQYTWWSFKDLSRQANRGWRIDYICVTENLIERVSEVKIHNAQFGSDHCPVSIILEDEPGL